VVIFCKLLLDFYFLSASILLCVLFTYIIKTGLSFRVSDQVLHPYQTELKLKSFHWKFIVDEMALDQVVSPNEVVSSPLPPSCCPTNAPFPYTFSYYRRQSGYWKRHKLNHILEKNCNFYFTFVCPWIASMYLKYDRKNATFSRSIYFYKLLYMFQAVPPPIFRITKLYIQRQVLSNHTAAYCYCGWDRTACFWRFLRQSSEAQNTWRCMYSFVFLMMGGGTAKNM
jgi:hypothetical protein